jgi:predicted nuclease of predicted toxin-antitoxin system
LHILFDKNVPVGVRGFLPNHEVRTFVETQWPEQLKNGELLAMAEQAGFDVMVTSDQNIRYQQNLSGRKLALVVLGSNIWPYRHSELVTGEKFGPQFQAAGVVHGEHVHVGAAVIRSAPDNVPRRGIHR